MIKKLLFLFIFSTISFISHAPKIIIPHTSIYFEQTVPEQLFIDVRVEWIKRILDYIVTINDYKAHDGLTFCNVLARDVLDNRPHPIWMGYGFHIDAFPLDVKSVFPTPFSILSLSIKDAWIKADFAWKQGKIKRLSMEEAQEAANNGYIVWVISARWKHEAIVYPGEYDEKLGCWIIQAGGPGCNGIMQIYDDCAFGWRKTDIRFYQFEWKKLDN